MVDKTATCWNWTGAKDKYGYGSFTLWRNLNMKAYRFSFRLSGGVIPARFHLDHLCRNPSCVNPEHLEAVPGTVNVLRGNGPSAVNKRKTHCKRGHEFTPANTRTTTTGRECKECKRARWRNDYQENNGLAKQRKRRPPKGALRKP